MLFNSLVFIVFALVYFLVSKLIGKRVKLRLIWLTAMSFFFYGWWDWRFLFLIAFSGFIDYFGAMAMEKWEKHRKLLMILSISGNLGSLSIFKYAGFVAQSLDSLFGLSGQFSLANNIPEFFLITPVGISFYTFHSMNYTLDVYQRKIKATKDVFHFFAFISMFPQLVAGPILRAKEILPQLLEIKPISNDERWDGFRLVVKGYFKKMVIADNLAPLVVAAFSAPDLNQSSVYWWGTMIAFALQIFCDFAGYTDIAKGLAKWMGYNFPDNFNHPYLSTSLRDFWTRWHISLSSWFRDYLYIPLGGNKGSKLRQHANMWVTMLVSGLWHGAAFTYILWGAVHAFFLSLEKITGWPAVFKRYKWLTFLGWFIVLIQVLVAWVFFRSVDLNQALDILKIMFSFKGNWQTGWGLNGSFFIAIIVMREILVATKWNKRIDWNKKQGIWAELVVYAVLIAMIIYFRGTGSEFIYFQF